MIQDLALVVHSFDGYDFLWPGWLHCFQKFFPKTFCKVYFVTEETPIHIQGITNLAVGKCEWSDRLLRAMDQIPEKKIMYMQEDHWFTRPVTPQELTVFYYTFQGLNLQYLLMAPKNPYEAGLGNSKNWVNPGPFKGFIVPPGHNLFYCHWVSLSNKSYLKLALKGGETFHHNEARGRERLKKHNAQLRQEPRHVFYKVDWYSSVHRHIVRSTVLRKDQEAELLKKKAPVQGVFNSYGQKVMTELGLL